MANAAVNITSPVGRLVAGSLYDAQDKDAEGKPLVIKNGPNAGQQRVDFFFAVAIPKESGHTHWAQTDWGAKSGRKVTPSFRRPRSPPTSLGRSLMAIAK